MADEHDTDIHDLQEQVFELQREINTLQHRLEEFVKRMNDRAFDG